MGQCPMWWHRAAIIPDNMIFVLRSCYFTPRRCAKYCDRCVCISVCLFTCMSQKPNFTKFTLHVSCGHGLDLLWRQCNMWHTSGFVEVCTHQLTCHISWWWMHSYVAGAVEALHTVCLCSIHGDKVHLPPWAVTGGKVCYPQLPCLVAQCCI